MANRSLGTLTLDLIARIGGFEAGLDKAEREAKKRAQAIERVFDKAGTAVGVAFSAAVAGAIVGAAAFDKLIKQVSEFQDIAEKTGGSAEGFAAFAVDASTAGVAMDSIVAASIRLTKGLSGVDDESKAAGAALAALGLNIQDFKSLTPEDQIEAVAMALGRFEDGAQKTAVAVALFGKAGAELLPFLKELEAQGGRQVLLTNEQIRQADEYADRQSKVKGELQLYAQAIAVQMLPAVTALTEVLIESAQGMLGLEKAGDQLRNNKSILQFAEETASFLAATVDRACDVADGFTYVGRTIAATGAVVAAAARGDFAQIPAILKAAREDGEKLFKSDFAGRVAAQFNKARADLANFDDEARRRGGRGTTATLNFEGAAAKDKKAKADRQTEAEKYLESLQMQLQKTSELSVEETLLAEIQSGRLKISGKVTQDQLVGLARQIDAAKEYQEVVKAGRDQAIAEGDAVNKANEAYQARLKAMLDATPTANLEKQRADVQLLTDEYLRFIETNGAAGISEEQYLEAVSARLDLTADKLQKADTFAQKFAENVQDALGQGLADILDGNFVNIGDSFVRMVNRMVAEAVAADLSKALLGDLITGGGGDGVFGSILKSFTSSLSAASSSGGSNPSAFLSGGGNLLGSIVDGAKNLFSGFFADGGTIPAGHFGVVGESGAELVSGPATVTPMGKVGGMNLTINQSFAPGTDRKTVDQAAAAAGRRVQMAIARNT